MCRPWGCTAPPIGFLPQPNPFLNPVTGQPEKSFKKELYYNQQENNNKKWANKTCDILNSQAYKYRFLILQSLTHSSMEGPITFHILSILGPSAIILFSCLTTTQSLSKLSWPFLDKLEHSLLKPKINFPLTPAARILLSYSI